MFSFDNIDIWLTFDKMKKEGAKITKNFLVFCLHLTQYFAR